MERLRQRKRKHRRSTTRQQKSIRTTIEKNPDAMSEEGICKYFKIKKLEDMTMVQMREWLRLINEGGKKK